MMDHISFGAGAPTSTPTEVGHHYIDTTNKLSYVSVGTSSAADWRGTGAAAVLSAFLAGLDVTTSGDITDEDTILSALGKLQYQLDHLVDPAPLYGVGVPEGVVAAPPGSHYWQINIGDWVKNEGTGNTGWIRFITL